MKTIREGSPSTAIELRGVEKAFGAHRVLKGVDLKVRFGQVLGLLGKNGAGKSTLISIMCGLAPADAGTIRVCGKDPAKDNIGTLIGLAQQDIGVYPQLSVEQNLVGLGAVQGLSRSEAHARAVEVMRELGLEKLARRCARDLSGGERRRLHTSIALMHRPRVIFLDEPTVGADVGARKRILKAVRSLADTGVAVVYTTHYLGELEDLNADIACLDRGEIVAVGTLRQIVDAHAEPTVRVSFKEGSAPSVAGWRAVEGAIEPVALVDDPGAALAQLLAEPAVQGFTLADVRVIHANLETAYLNIINQEVPHVA